MNRRVCDICDDTIADDDKHLAWIRIELISNGSGRGSRDLCSTPCARTYIDWLDAYALQPDPLVFADWLAARLAQEEAEEAEEEPDEAAVALDNFTKALAPAMRGGKGRK